MNIFKDSTKLQNIIAVSLIFGAVFLLFRGLFLGKIIATNDIGSNDLLYFYLPIKSLYSQALRNGEFLQWTPLIYGGFPIFAEGQGGFLYPLNLIIWYFLNPVAAMNTYIIVHALLMGFGVYLFTSKLTGNRLYSIPAAVAASICGSVIAGHTRHLNSLTAIVYAPLLFYSVEQFLRTKKISNGLIFGMLFGIMVLGGHPQHVFISGFFALLYFILRIFFDKKPGLSFIKRIKEYKAIHFLGLSIALSLLIGLPQIQSTLELVPFTERGQNLSSEFTGLGSLPFSGFLTFIYPYYMGNAGDMTFESEYIFFFWEFFYYSGVVTFVLALIGCISMRKRAEYRSIIRSLIIIALVSYLLALGENFPLYKIFSVFPIIKSFRFPARWFAGTELSVLALSGFGVLAIAEFLSKEKFGNKQNRKKTKQVKSISEKNTVITATQYKLSIILSIVIVFEIFIVAGRQVVTADAGIYLSPPSFVEKISYDNKSFPSSRIYTLGRTEFLTEVFYTSKGWEGSHDFYGLSAKLLPPNFGAYFNLPIIDGYLLLVPNFIYEVWGNANNSGIIVKTATRNNEKFYPSDKFIKLSRLFGVKFITSIWNIQNPYVNVWDSLRVKLYELPENLPKAWVVSNVKSFTMNDEKLNAERLIDTNFNPWSTAFVNGISPSLPVNSNNGSAEILRYDNHSVTVKANEAGFLVLNDTWYPRWKAYIDGVETPVYKTDIMIRGVVVPNPGSVIEFKYDTGYTYLYVIISYLSVLISTGFLIFEKRKFRNYNNKQS